MYQRRCNLGGDIYGVMVRSERPKPFSTKPEIHYPASMYAKSIVNIDSDSCDSDSDHGSSCSDAARDDPNDSDDIFAIDDDNSSSGVVSLEEMTLSSNHLDARHDHEHEFHHLGLYRTSSGRNLIHI
jgi:hypothetical protein